MENLGKLLTCCGLIFLVSQVSEAHDCCPNHKVTPGLNFNCSDGSSYKLNCSHENFYRSDIDSYQIENGTLTMSVSSGVNRVSKGLFCIAKEQGVDSIKEVIILCLDPEDKEAEQDLLQTSSYLIASDVFLLLTFVTYCWLPSLRQDLQGKAVMCFTANLFIALLLLTYVQQYFFKEITHDPDPVCIFGGFLVYFWLLSVFFWLFVISFNIWRLISLGSFASERKLWMIYNGIGYGLPLMCTIFLFAYQSFAQLSEIDKQTCLFHGVLEAWLFLCVPILLVILGNSIFFALAVKGLDGVDNERGAQSPRRRTLQYQLSLHLKLFIVMGAIWIYEILSFAFENNWFVMEIVLSLQGFLVFLLLVLTRRKVVQTVCSKSVSRGSQWQSMENEMSSSMDEDEENI